MCAGARKEAGGGMDGQANLKDLDNGRLQKPAFSLLLNLSLHKAAATMQCLLSFLQFWDVAIEG